MAKKPKSLPKIKAPVQRPNRDPDHYSKRGVPYFWAPDWVRGVMADNILSPQDDLNCEQYRDELILNLNGEHVWPARSYGKIYPVKEKNGEVNLYMRAKDGNLTFIRGSIQKEFKKWFTDRSIDYLLFGMDPDELIADAE